MCLLNWRYEMYATTENTFPNYTRTMNIPKPQLDEMTDIQNV